MKEAAQILNEMIREGVITNYALFGALAQMRYTPTVATLDADVLVLIPNENRLDVLSPLYAFCRSRGYQPEGEAVRIGDWPVQFIPAYDALTRETVEQAEVSEIQGEPVRVATALHLVLLALRTGRRKDDLRILALLEHDAVRRDDIREAAERHGLHAAWQKFLERYGDTR